MADKLLHELLREVRDDVKEIREALPVMRKDIDNATTFIDRLKTMGWVAAIGGGGTGVSWLSGLFDAVTKGQTGTH